MKMCKGEKLADLQARLKQLQLADSLKTNTQIRSEIKKIQREIENILEIRKKLIFLKQRNYEVGARSAKILVYKLCKHKMENVIHKIRNPKTNNIIENTRRGIKECFESFLPRIIYSTASEEHNEGFLNGLDLPKIKDWLNETLVSPVMVKELNFGISRLKSGKTPGCNGFTRE